MIQAPPRRKTARRRCIRLSGIDWRTYSRLLRAFAEHSGIRMAYDRGELEIMSPLLVHDNPAWILGLVVLALGRALKLPVKCGGATTLRRQLKQKGIEPDACFWIMNAHLILGVDRLDLCQHPPPDLAIEVDVTNSSLDRMGIYAALQVPEVWRLDDKVLTLNALQPDGTYAVTTHSTAFPLVTPADLLGFLHQGRQSVDEWALIDEVQQWVRQQQAANP